jgi:hypothetical protein
LTGLVVVAISINLPRILSYAHLPTRAGEALIGPVGAIVVTTLVLVPEQPAWLLGLEIILIGLAMAIALSSSSAPLHGLNLPRLTGEMEKTGDRFPPTNSRGSPRS